MTETSIKPRENSAALTPPNDGPSQRLPRVEIDVVGGKPDIRVLRASETQGFGGASRDFTENAVKQLIGLVIAGNVDPHTCALPDGPLDTDEINALVALVCAVEPQDDLECAVGVQLAMLYRAALNCGLRAQIRGGHPESRVQNLNLVGKLARSYAMLLDALSRHRGKVVTQRFVVEQVNVGPGGQAVVGVVEGGGLSEKAENKPMNAGMKAERATPRCLARNRAGKPCQRPATKGRKRCHLHGGAAGSGGQMGNRNALRHGLYSADAIETRRTVRALLRQARDLVRES